MTAYTFTAIDKFGHKHNGVMDADNIKRIRQQLRSQGWVPLSIKAPSKNIISRGISGKQRSVFSSAALTRFTRDLAILLDGGLQLENALHLLAMQAQNPRMRDYILNVRTQITEGVSFSKALANYPDDFPLLYRATIDAGEHVGDVKGVLNKLAEYGETHQKLMSKIKLMMLYPVILSVFATIVVIAMLVFVFPDIAKTFTQSGQELPMLTLLLMNISDFLRQFGLYIVIMLIAAGIYARHALKKPQKLFALHRLLLKTPLIHKLVTATDLSRFTATLSMLRESGLSMTEALRISSEVVNNRYLRKATEQVNHLVIEGLSLSQAMTHANCFPLSYVHMVASGEASGELDRILHLSANNQSRELEKQMMFGVAFLEPMIILALGLMVLLVVLAIMMPILSMNQLVN